MPVRVDKHETPGGGVSCSLKNLINSRVETVQTDDTLQRAAGKMRELDVEIIACVRRESASGDDHRP